MLERCVQTGLMRDFGKERQRYQHRENQIKLAAQGQRAHAIARVCARHELESDEFETAEQKALRYL